MCILALDLRLDIKFVLTSNASWFMFNECRPRPTQCVCFWFLSGLIQLGRANKLQLKAAFIINIINISKLWCFSPAHISESSGQPQRCIAQLTYPSARTAGSSSVWLDVGGTAGKTQSRRFKSKYWEVTELFVVGLNTGLESKQTGDVIFLKNKCCDDYSRYGWMDPCICMHRIHQLWKQDNPARNKPAYSISTPDYIIDMEVSWGEASGAEGYLDSERFSGLPGTYTDRISMRPMLRTGENEKRVNIHSGLHVVALVYRNEPRADVSEHLSYAQSE